MDKMKKPDLMEIDIEAEPKDKPEMGEDEDDVKMEMAGKLADAVKSGDRKGIVTAFEDMLEACKGY